MRRPDKLSSPPSKSLESPVPSSRVSLAAKYRRKEALVASPAARSGATPEQVPSFYSPDSQRIE
eukprot:2189782-Rhodomonas_salina.1